MQQIFHLEYFSFIAVIMIFDRFPKVGRAKRDAWRAFTGNGKSVLVWLVSSKTNLPQALFPTVK